MVATSASSMRASSSARCGAHVTRTRTYPSAPAPAALDARAAAAKCASNLSSYAYPAGSHRHWRGAAHSRTTVGPAMASASSLYWSSSTGPPAASTHPPGSAPPSSCERLSACTATGSSSTKSTSTLSSSLFPSSASTFALCKGPRVNRKKNDLLQSWLLHWVSPIHQTFVILCDQRICLSPPVLLQANPLGVVVESETNAVNTGRPAPPSRPVSSFCSAR
eukprot:1183393-Prorocentrum_minimum.AAC.6